MSDDVFRLGWLDNLELAGHCLATLGEKAAQYRTLNLSEGDTVAIFVEPLLRGLGWDTLDLDEVNRESQRSWLFGDIHLLGKDQGGNKKVAVVIEAKSLGAADLDGAYSQLRGYVLDRLFTAQADSDNEQVRCNHRVRLELGGRPFVRGLVTNGARWTIYDFDPTVAPLEQHKPICTFELKHNSDVSALVHAIGRSHLLRGLGLQESHNLHGSSR